MKPFIITSYYTKDSLYTQKAKNLANSLKKFNLEYAIEPIDDLGSWYANTLYKGVFIKKMLNAYNRNIVWLDGDSIMHRYPILFDTITADIAMPIIDWSLYTERKVKEWASGTLYFANNKRTHKVVNEWIEINKTIPSYDQLNLRKAIENNLPLIKFIRLPDNYIKIFDKMSKITDPVIETFQASRKTEK